MEESIKKLIDLGINSGIKILEALLILWIGSKIIKLLVKGLKKGKLFNKM